MFWNNKHSILIDCGFGIHYLNDTLKRIEKYINNLSGVLITHLHSDHIRYSSLKAILTAKIPVYCSSKVRNFLINNFDFIKNRKFEHLIKTFDGDEFSVDSFAIKAFEVPHDSPGGCVGFNITSEFSPDKKVSYATDLGFIPEHLFDSFHNSEFIVIESNHDIEMLENSKRSEELKKRIRTIGHLSNDVSSSFIQEIVKRSNRTPKGIMLAHISQECNTNQKARDAHEQALSELKINDIPVFETFRIASNKIIKI